MAATIPNVCEVGNWLINSIAKPVTNNWTKIPLSPTMQKSINLMDTFPLSI